MTRREGSKRGGYQVNAHGEVTVSIVRDRYEAGELLVLSSYRRSDGNERRGQPLRVYLDPDLARTIPGIWNTVFDEVLKVQQETARGVRLLFVADDMPAWQERVETILRVIAHELHVPLRVKEKSQNP